MLLATFFVALLGYIFATSPSVSAIEGTWQGDKLVFDDKTYEAVDNKDSLPDEIKASPHVYQFTDTTTNPNLVYFIYFASDVVDPQREGEATYIRYTLNPPNRYVNPFDKLTIALVPIAPSGDTATTDEPILTSSCTIGGIGWIVCPLMNGIAEVMDFVFERIRSFLAVQPITTSVDNPIYRIWMYSRDLANIAFIIGFMVIIYSYLVGGGFNGYEIRKILPRLVIAAVLINVSYILCAAAVDISNIAGYGVNQLFENVRDEVLPGSSTTADVNWTSVTTWVLAGGVGVGVLANVAPLATGGTLAAAGLWGLLSPFLVGGALLIMVTFFILAARQAIIVLLIAIAPLAFAAFILPNTEKWFERWRSLFFTMLIMFPAFGAVFGASQLAGEVLIRTATSIEQIILGLGVMVAPLAITPLLLRLGGGVLNRFGGIVNNPQKGIYDRYKSYNSERRQDFLATQNRLNAQRNDDGTLTGGRNFMRRAAYRKNLKNYNRKRLREADTGRAEGFYDDDDLGVETLRSRTGRQYARARGRGAQYTPTYQYGSAEIAEIKHDTGLLHNYTEARHGEHWQETLRHDPRRAGMQTATKLAAGRAKIDEDYMAAADESYLQQSLNGGTTARYAALRDARIQTSVSKGVGEANSSEIDAAGKLALSATIDNSPDLQAMKVRTYANEKRAETLENVFKKNAEANWSDLSRNDVDVQQLRVREMRAEDQAKLSEASFNKMAASIRSSGAAAPGLQPQNIQAARELKQLATDIIFEEKGTAAMTSQVQALGEQLYVDSAEGRRLNIRTQTAQDLLEGAKLNEAAIVQEWRTEKGSKDLKGENAALAASLRDADYTKRVKTQRTGAAKRQSDMEYASDVMAVDKKDNPTPQALELIEEAGGIEGEAGMTQAKATAFKTIVEAQNTGVANARMLLSRVDNHVLLGEGKDGLYADDILDQPTEKISAIGSTLAGRYHQESHIKLWQRMGELEITVNKELEAAEASQDEKAIATAKDRLGKVKDLQQQVMADKKKDPFGIGDKDKGDANVGTYENNVYKSTRERISTHLSASKLSTMDPDDLRLIFEMARAGKLNPAELEKVKTTYIEWQKDDNLKAMIEDKHRDLLDPIAELATNGGDVEAAFRDKMPNPDPPEDDPKYFDKWAYKFEVEKTPPRSDPENNESDTLF